MANILIKKTEEHLVQRAGERFSLGCEDAKRLIQQVKETLEKQAPEDWRFTVSPTAMFFVAFDPEDKDMRFVGRSYRDCEDIGARIMDRLKAERLTREVLNSLAQQYVLLLRSPRCQIYHELKTIYRKGQDISQEKTIFSTITSELTHIVPIRAKRVASRPNAIIRNDEIWVRQGEYLDLSSETGADYREHLIFERLTPEGVDKSIIHYYSINKQGKLIFDHEFKRSTISIGSTLGKGICGRSQSYWTLPTYVDAVYMDLKYAAEHWQGDTKPEECLRSENTLLLLRTKKLMELTERLIFG